MRNLLLLSVLALLCRYQLRFEKQSNSRQLGFVNKTRLVLSLNTTRTRLCFRQLMTILRKTVPHKPTLRPSLERNGHLPTVNQTVNFTVLPILHRPTPALPRMGSLQFEVLLLIYLICAMSIQYINIYKANFYIMDYHLVIFICIIMTRRISWLVLKQTLASEVVHSFRYWSVVGFKCALLLGMAVLCLYSLWHVIQNSAFEDVLFLCYPLVVYLLTFGFTMNPYGHRVLFKLNGHQSLQMQEIVSDNTSLLQHTFTLHNITIRPSTEGKNERIIDCTLSPVVSEERRAKVNASSKSNGKSNAGAISNGHTSATPTESYLASSFTNGKTWQCPATPCNISPDSVRYEAECLRTDFNLRMKQIMFNSLMSAYYTGFVPVKFTQNGWLYYDLCWSAHHILFIWLNSFVLLLVLLVPHHYTDGLHKCAQHLGGWKQYKGQRETPHVWSPLTTWQQGILVRHSKGVYRAMGKQNASIPGDAHHSRFYFFFKRPLRLLNWVTVLQLSTVVYQLYVLSRSAAWFQCIAVAAMLAVNYAILFSLLRDRWAVQATLEDHDDCVGSLGLQN